MIWFLATHPWLKIFGACSILFFILSCIPPVSRERVTEEALPFFAREDHPPPFSDDLDEESLRRALKRSLEVAKQRVPSAPPLLWEMHFSAEDLRRTLETFREVLNSPPRGKSLAEEVREKFLAYRPLGESPSGKVFFTGYYEPTLEGSLQEDDRYRYPLYKKPDGLPPAGRGTYWTREEIDCQKALRGKGLELVYLSDPVEAFFLHVQGSGQIRLPDGKTLRVGYAGSNGYPYRSIGKYLVEKGILPERELSLQRVKEYLRQNPSRAQEIFNVNGRYIFFRVVSGEEGPVGSLGFPLVAGRSLAMDLNLFPPGALAFMVCRQPILDTQNKLAGWKKVSRFVFVHDTGAAMKGFSRADLFFGSGEEAGRAAGMMKEEGDLFFLIARRRSPLQGAMPILPPPSFLENIGGIRNPCQAQSRQWRDWLANLPPA
jgi:membrane-bound lytic murein transglycosylase A